MSQVGDTDSGKYSCRPSNTDLASTMVYVIRGDQTCLDRNQTIMFGELNNKIKDVSFTKFFFQTSTSRI